MDMDPDKLRKRFHSLTAKGAAIRAKSDPIRKKRDATIVNQAKTLDELNKKLRDAESGLYEIEQERAMIARALGGRVGEPASE